MRRLLQPMLLLALGATVVYVVLTEEHLNHVKPSLTPFLLGAGLVLLILGALALREAAALRRLPARHRDGHDHEHHEPRAAWALVLPVAAVLLLPGAPLGAFTAARADAYVQPAPSSALFPALVGDPADVSMGDFVRRAVWDNGLTLDGQRVRLVGFVSPAEGGGWHLARLGMSCCAADAFVLKVLPLGAPEMAADTWVEVIGRWQPGNLGDELIPQLAVETVNPVPAPENPYDI